MAGFLAVLKTIFVPALVSLVLYLLLTYVVLPLVRKHRQRYNQYSPLNAISDHTSSLRRRIVGFLSTRLLPPAWNWNRSRLVDGSRPESSEDDQFDDEEGEAMAGFSIDERRREALDRRRSSVDDPERRLSRDLEEGFKDDSDEEHDSRFLKNFLEMVRSR